MSNETDKGMATEPADPGSAGPEDLMPSEWTHEQVEQWREQASKSQEHWDRLVRISADFENYKKRAMRERQDAARFANESLLQKLLPVLDNLEMALAAAGNASGDATDALKTGVSMIHNQFRSILAETGLEEIQAQGRPFDPNWHEAVAQQASGEVPEGHVLQQVRRGFKLNERLVRPASVVVAKKPAA